MSDKTIVYSILLMTVIAGFFAGSGKSMKAVVQRGAVSSVLICAAYFALLMWVHTLTPPKIQ